NSSSPTHATWNLQATTDWSTNSAGPMPPVVYVGICCAAHTNNALDATVLNYYYTASFADYNSSFGQTSTGKATLSAKISGNHVTIAGAPAGGTPKSSRRVGGGATWTAVPNATNPLTITPGAAADAFYRVAP